MASQTCGHTQYHQFLVSRELGGGAQVALDLANFLATQGKESRIWVPGTGLTWSQAEQTGLPVQGYDLTSALGPSRLQAARVNWQVWRRVRGFGRGLVHVHSPVVYGAFRRGLGYSGLKQVVHVQVDQDEEGLRWALRWPPDLIITCARYLVDPVRRALTERRRERQRIVAVPNAVDTAKFAPGDKAEAKRKVGAPAGVPLALMLANLAPHKGQETAIRAAALLQGRGVTTHFWLAGTERGGAGTYTARLHSLIREAGVADRVRLLGQRSDAPDLLRAADFFLLPSTCEGLPLSILEAQATRVPVLAAPTAGVPEVVWDGTTGFLIAADDAEGYARRVEQLLANPALADRVAEAAFLHTTREYSWPAFCRRVVDLYDEVLEGGATRTGARPFVAGRHPVNAGRPEPCRS
jgi:glycosyltransferase involved in cell wall biosynthesis